MPKSATAKKDTCYGCNRGLRECWTMPCLVLEDTMARGDGAMKARGKRCGVRVQKSDGTVL